MSKKRTLHANPKPRCTRPKQDEAATRTWQATFDAIADSICIIDRDGKILQCNKAMEKFLGMVSADIIGHTCWELVHRSDKPISGCPGQKAFQTHCRETKILPINGHWLEVTADPIIDEKGIVISCVHVIADITERVRTREALQDSEERFRTLFEYNPNPYQSLNADGNIIEVNSAWLDTLGYTRDEVIGKWFGDFVTKHYQEIFRERFLRYKEQGAILGAEFDMVCKDGKTRTVLFNGRISKTPDGQFRQTHCVFTDITNRIKMGMALKESEERFRALIENASEGFAIINADGTIRYESPASERIGGRAPGETCGTNILDYIHEDDRLRLAEDFMRLIEEPDTIIQTHYRGLHKDGSWRIIEATGNNLLENPCIHGLVVNYRDVTGRSKAEEALKESERKITTLISNLPGLVYRCINNKDWTMQFISEGCLQLTGYHPSDLEMNQTVSWNSIIHPEDRQLVWDEIQRAISQSESFKINYRIMTRSGETKWVWEQGVSVAIDDGADIELEGFITDITERKRAEEELKRMMEELERSNQDLEQFAHVVSHDLQEPLRMVASYVQLLEKRYKDQLDQDANDFINFAADGAIRMQRMILDILEYSRVGTSGQAFKQIDMNSVLTKAMANLGGQIEDSGALITNDELPQVFADDIQVMQLFQNLIGNAIKFRSEDTPQIHVSSKKVKSEWVISIKDNGIGIPQEHQDKVFAVFRKLHAIGQYPGSGIGLAIAAKIVGRHRGKIWVESEPGKGSTFYFSIPKVRPRES